MSDSLISRSSENLLQTFCLVEDTLLHLTGTYRHIKYCSEHNLYAAEIT